MYMNRFQKIAVRLLAGAMCIGGGVWISRGSLQDWYINQGESGKGGQIESTSPSSAARGHDASMLGQENLARNRGVASSGAMTASQGFQDHQSSVRNGASNSVHGKSFSQLFLSANRAEHDYAAYHLRFKCVATDLAAAIASQEKFADKKFPGRRADLVNGVTGLYNACAAAGSIVGSEALAKQGIDHARSTRAPSLVLGKFRGDVAQLDPEGVTALQEVMQTPLYGTLANRVLPYIDKSEVLSLIPNQGTEGPESLLVLVVLGCRMGLDCRAESIERQWLCAEYAFCDKQSVEAAVWTHMHSIGVDMSKFDAALRKLQDRIGRGDLTMFKKRV